MKNLLLGLLCAVATAHTAIAVAQSAPLGHPPGTLHPKVVPVDPKGADDRKRRQVSEDETQVRRTGERDSYGKGRDAVRRPTGEDKEQLKAERGARTVNPEAESPNRRADSPSRNR